METLQPMRLKVGSPVVGGNFFEHRAILKRFESRLEQSSFCFVGPRRTGKTSILHHYEKNPPGDYIPIHLDLQKFTTADEWLENLIEKTREALLPAPGAAKAWLKQRGADCAKLIGRVESISVPTVGDVKLRSDTSKWSKRFDAFLKLIREAELPVLFLFDEFPYMVDHIRARSTKEGKQEEKELLQWFRAARIELSDAPIRFVLTGSIGLEGYLRRYGLSQEINDLDTLEIKPLSDADAEILIRRLCLGEGIPMAKNAPAVICQLLGVNWPYHIQLFLSELKEFLDGGDDSGAGTGARKPTKPPTPTVLRHVYESLYKGNRDKYCQEMRDRLSPFERGDRVPIFQETGANFAHILLKACAKAEDGLASSEIETIQAGLFSQEDLRTAFQGDLNYVIETLLHDGYVTRADAAPHNMRFASNLLRDFWRYHCS